MDSRDLKSASSYVNNLLASRGILRDAPIDFAKPNRDGTAVRIINLIRELLNQQDKDTEQKEALAIAIRSLRSSESQHKIDADQLKNRIHALERTNSLLQAQTRSMTQISRSQETTSKTLRDEFQRLKFTLSHVRSQHSIELRKRDNQINSMKEKILSSSRGTRAGVSTIIVNGGASDLRCEGNHGGEVQSTLAEDTAGFLTTLSQNLADENDCLLSLLRHCIANLREVQGLTENVIDDVDDERYTETERNPAVKISSDHKAIAFELDELMQSMHSMLNQPNFVPVEELAERDHDILHLQERNNVLHQEWRKALDLVEMWNKTAQGTGSGVPLNGQPSQMSELSELIIGRPHSGSIPAPPVDMPNVSKYPAECSPGASSLVEKKKTEKRRRSSRNKPKLQFFEHANHSPSPKRTRRTMDL